MPFFPKISFRLRILLSIAAALFALELLLEFAVYLVNRSWSRQVKPHYSWSTYTSYGAHLGSKKGYIKLQLRPFITYGNFPNQTTPYFSVNSRGYRGKEVTEKVAGKPRIVIVGGSAAFGSGLDRDDDTFAVRLENLLGADVVNASVIGHQSGQELVYLTTELIDLAPDLVVAFDGWNDFMQISWIRDIPQVGDVSFFQIERQLEELHDLTQGSVFERLTMGIARVLFPTITHGLNVGLRNQAGNSRISAEDVEKEARLYAGNEAKMARIARLAGAKFIAFIQPDRRCVQGADRGPEASQGNGYDLFRKRAAELLAQERVASVDLNAEPGIDQDVFMDNVHLDAKGHAAVGEIIARVVRERGGL